MRLERYAREAYSSLIFERYTLMDHHHHEENLHEQGEHDHHNNDHTHEHHEEHDHDDREHDHDHGRGILGKLFHNHAGDDHGGADTNLYGDQAGLRAVQISSAGMLLVALIQFAIALIGGSAGLFADALHNFGDVLTTVALWIAFVLSRRAANARYTYGYYRAEDLSGIFIGLVILASAVAGAVESLQKLTSGAVPTQLFLSMAAALVGVAGNEILAQYKVSVGRRINSVALIADGQHSRIDGLTSLAAFLGLVGVALGWPLADPIAGLVITLVIVSVVYATARSVIRRLLDAVDPHIVPSVLEVASAVPGVEAVTEPHARWVGHRLHISLNIEVDPHLTLEKAHEIAEEVRHRLFHRIKGVAEVFIHTDPASDHGDFHQLMAHHQQLAQQPIVER